MGECVCVCGQAEVINLCVNHIIVALQWIQIQLMSVGEKERAMVKINHDVMSHKP